MPIKGLYLTLQTRDILDIRVKLLIVKYMPSFSIEFLARPLNLAAMSNLRLGVLSQTREILHLPGISESCTDSVSNGLYQ